MVYWNIWIENTLHAYVLGERTSMKYELFIVQDRKNILKMNKEVGMLLPKKRANTSGVGKINNYCEDIYIPPYNNTH